MTLSEQFRDIPEPFGTTAIPEGHIRLNHYTRPHSGMTAEEAGARIKSEGLLRKHAEESYAHGGTEYPAIFASAGNPSEDLLRRAVVVEAHADPTKLDVGQLYPSQNTPENRSAMEKRNSTVTFHGDLPASQIVGVHQPWHSVFRYLQNDPGMEHGIMHGDYDNTGDPETDRAIAATKVVLAGKVMLGGKLGNR